jgi:hypothetical protein
MVRHHAAVDGIAQGGVAVLLDKSAPGFAAPIAQHDAKTVGDAGDGAAVGVAKGVTYRFLAHLFRCAPPNVAEFVTQAQMIAMAEAIQTRFGTFFFEIEEAARHLGVDAAALEDATVDHYLYYRGACCHFRSGNHLRITDGVP